MYKNNNNTQYKQLNDAYDINYKKNESVQIKTTSKSIGKNQKKKLCQGGCHVLTEYDTRYINKEQRLYKKYCVDCGIEITKKLMHETGMVRYCKNLFDNIHPEYTCSYVQCLNCTQKDTMDRDESRIGRTTRKCKVVMVQV